MLPVLFVQTHELQVTGDDVSSGNVCFIVCVLCVCWLVVRLCEGHLKG